MGRLAWEAYSIARDDFLIVLGKRRPTALPPRHPW